jgi:hypothetical protein
MGEAGWRHNSAGLLVTGGVVVESLALTTACWLALQQEVVVALRGNGGVRSCCVTLGPGHISGGVVHVCVVRRLLFVHGLV